MSVRGAHLQGMLRRLDGAVDPTTAPRHADPTQQVAALKAPQRAMPAQLMALQRSHGNQVVQRLVNQARQGPLVTEPAGHGPDGGQVDSQVEGHIQRARGRGQALDRQVGTSVGEQLGADLSGVRVHTDANADRVSRSLNAEAFTVGRDVFFRQGAYAPASGEGRKLLTHELTHVVQQGGAQQPVAHRSSLRVGAAHAPYEREAHAAANGGPGKVSPTGSEVIQRFVKVGARSSPLGVALRVSEDGKLATPDAPVFEGTKLLYATSSVINAARTKLENVESPYTVARDSDDSIRLAIPGSGGIFKRKQYQTLYRVVPHDTRKEGEESSGTAIKTIEACSAHGLDFMGVGINSKEQARSNREAKIQAGSQDVTNVGSFLAAGRNDLAARDLIQTAIARLELKLDDDAPNPERSQAKAIYQGLSEKKRNQYAQMFGINQYADPEVGEGIESLRAAGEGAQGSFPMHFAPVIAKSGSDYVTFENFARALEDRTEGDTDSASSQWFFRMYGAYKKGKGLSKDDDQTYYGQHAKEGSIGTRSELMGLRNRNVAKDDSDD